jgi:hypothetical protein
VRTSAGIGASRTTGKAQGESLTGDGMAVALRGELVQPLSYLKDFEVGLRAGIVGHDAMAKPDGVDVDAEAGELSLAGVVRGYVPFGGISFYGEGFAGYAHNWGTVVGGPIDVADDGGGLLVGAGAGVQWQNGLHFGIEWSRRDFDLGPDVQIQTDDLMFVFGGVLRF